MITVIYAHPYSKQSRMGKAMQNALHNLPHVHSRNLYELYPDFSIDIEAEQAHLLKSSTIILQHPLFWFHCPAMMTHWFEKVLAHGWAYGRNEKGERAQALAGKRVLWATSTGSSESAYSIEGYNQHTLAQLSLSIQQTMLFCGLEWLEPFTVYHADKISDEEALLAAEAYRERVVKELQWLEHRQLLQHPPKTATDKVETEAANLQLTK